MQYRWLLLLLLAVPLHAQSAAQSAAAGIQYLARVMDAYHDRFPVYEDVSAAGNHFHAYAKIPDGGALVAMNGSWSATKYSGATSIRCTYDPATPAGFGGFYFQNGTLSGSQSAPEANFGTVPNAGIDLTGATALTFRARGEAGGEQVEFFLGGVGHPGAPYPDSSPRIPAQGTRTVLTTQWTHYSIDLTGANLSYVLGGFGWVADSDHNPGGAVFYLDDIQYVLSEERKNERLNEARFLRSFTTLPVQDDGIDSVFRNLASTYDNALAILAFLAHGSADSVRRARLVGDAFVYATQHDVRFNDNRACDAAVSPLTDDGARLRSAYAAGDLAVPPGWTPQGRAGTVRLPGFYDEATQTFHEVEQTAADSGNNAWAMLALLALHQETAEPSYLETACRLGNFIDAFRNDSGTYQGFTAGVSYHPNPAAPSLRTFASSEHNLDVYAAFARLHAVTGAARWLSGAEHARAFVAAMVNGATGCYFAGTVDPSTRNTNANQLPVDVQAWAVLALPNPPVSAAATLDCAEAQHLTSDGGFTGFDFNDDRDGVWFEGTAQMAVAYALAGENSNAETYRQALRSAQQTAANADGEGLVAASRDGLTTGFDTAAGTPFHYFRRLHVGATAWNVFAQLGVNPYYEPLAAPAAIDAHYTGTAAAIAWRPVAGAGGYTVVRQDGHLIATTATSALDATVSAGSSYLYRVYASRAGMAISPFSAPALTTAVTFTDDPLVPFATIVKAAHVTELRGAVNAVRTLAGLLPASFSDPSLAGLPIRAAHITELRNALAPARALLEQPPLSFGALSAVRATDVTTLRDGVE